MAAPMATPAAEIPLADLRPQRGERERHDLNKLSKRLRRQVGQAIMDYNMIVDGDRVMVCLSGGKFYAI